MKSSGSLNNISHQTLLLLIIIVGLAFLAYFFSTNLVSFFRKPSAESKPTVLEFTDRQIRQVVINEQILEIEVVTKPESLAQGLSDRQALGSDGMLFILQKQGIPVFWMKGMLFDLDLLWIKDARIVEMSENVPHPEPGTPLNQLPHYQPTQSVDWVLEIPAGEARRRGFKVGQDLEWR